jgi:nitroimidazol reductase NimA-like FMN-containing flavoprotein (pyridoxamine 5'-phosphate oxidase superfamily)
MSDSVVNDSVKAILGGSILGVLATVNDDGSPRATPLHFFYDATGLYWFSQKNTQHAINCRGGARVSLSVFSPDESEGIKGVYVSGTVEEIDATTPRYEAARKLVEARLGVIPPVFEGATAYFVPFGKLDTKKSYGNCWYFYS